MNQLWSNISKKDVIKAIELFDKQKENFPEPRNTFLLYNNRKFPAKHIRGLAYEVANKQTIPKNEFNGGKETANFFLNLGFKVEYRMKKLTSKEAIKLTYKIQNEETESIHKIARIILTGKYFTNNGKPIIKKLESLIEQFVSATYQHQKFELVVTCGGFLSFKFPKKLQYEIDIPNAEKIIIPELFNEASKVIKDFWGHLNDETYRKLKEIADFFTIGIDGFNPINFQTIELVAVYDLKKEIIQRWTGKFYPTTGEMNSVIKINDLTSHFIELGKNKVLLLGCHDLNVFSHRAQANSNRNGWRRKTANKFQKLCIEFKPSIVLQHPHKTFSPNIWRLGWSGLMEEIPTVKHYASGINYMKRVESNILRPKQKVLDQTKKGDVIDFSF